MIKKLGVVTAVAVVTTLFVFMQPVVPELTPVDEVILADLGSVPLSEVEPPVYTERFATTGGQDVVWGAGDVYFDQQSGFPGFGYPILICGLERTGTEIRLLTDYGQYHYQFKEEVPGYEVDGSLVDNFGKPIINFFEKAENLYVVVGRSVKIYEFVNGTKIVSE